MWRDGSLFLALDLRIYCFREGDVPVETGVGDEGCCEGVSFTCGSRRAVSCVRAWKWTRIVIECMHLFLGLQRGLHNHHLVCRRSDRKPSIHESAMPVVVPGTASRPERK